MTTEIWDKTRKLRKRPASVARKQWAAFKQFTAKQRAAAEKAA